MSSAFEDLYRELALPQVMGFHGQTITYIDDDGGAGDSITAIIGAEEAELLEIPGERRRYRHRSVEVLSADVPSPRFPHTVTIDGEDWTVRELLGVQSGKARLLVTRPERVEQGGRRTQG